MTAPERRILFCTLGYEPGPIGGAERQAQLQAEELTRRGHRVEVVCPSHDRAMSAMQNGVRVHRLPRINRRWFRTITYLPVLGAWLLLRAGRFDLVHVHLANLQADVAAVATRLRRVPLYVKLAAGGPRGEIGRLRKIAWLTRYAGIRWAKRAQAISTEIERDLANIGVAQDRIVRIPNGLAVFGEELDSPRDREALREAIGIPREGVLVLFAGRFARYKGIDDLLAAWQRVVAVRDNAHLILVGEQAVDAPLDANPSGPQVIVHPWSSTVGRYYQACDVFVLPSHAEGMSNALLEAMSHGLAVVSTTTGAAPEMIDSGQSGLLVAAGDVDGLARALGELIDDARVRDRLGQCAAGVVAQRYSLSAVVDRIEAAYEAAIGEGMR